MRKILIIQTAFIGDVVLATSLVEKLHKFYPDARIDFLLKKGNEAILKDHPIINRVLIFDKSNKLRNVRVLIKDIRRYQYDLVVNLHRFLSSGLITALSCAKTKVGFNKNPLSIFYTKRFTHEISSSGNKHETERNHQLIEEFTDQEVEKPRLYPSEADFEKVNTYKLKPYLTIAPTSVWFTKQWPKHKWIEFISSVKNYTIYLLGAPSDTAYCGHILHQSTNDSVINLAGKLTILQSAALMKGAVMNFVNDSGPLHFASAMNAPVRAIFNSTVPQYGFGPLSDNAAVIETKEALECRPCGLHGYKECPEGHFKCGKNIDVSELLISIVNT